MRGFSIFSPVLGTILLAIAVIFAAQVTMQEHQKEVEISNFAHVATVTSVPNFAKWDSIYFFISEVRSAIYLPSTATGFVGGDLKKTVTDLLPEAVGIKKFATWKTFGGSEYRYFVENYGNFGKTVSVHPGSDRVIVSIRADAKDTPDFVVQLGANEKPYDTTTMKLFSSDFNFVIFYPYGEFYKTLGNIESSASYHNFWAGLFEAKDVSQWAPLVKISKQPGVGGSGVTVVKNLKITTGVTSWQEPAAAAISPWVDSKKAATLYGTPAYIRDALAEWIKKISDGNAWLENIISTDTEGKDGIKYFRLACLVGDLAEALTNGESPVICGKVDSSNKKYYELKNLDRVPYASIREINAVLGLRAPSKCAPDGSVVTSAYVTLDFGNGDAKAPTAELNKGIFGLPSGGNSGQETATCQSYTCNCNSNGDCDSGYTRPDKSAFEAAKDECVARCEEDTKGFLGRDDCLSDGICTFSYQTKDDEVYVNGEDVPSGCTPYSCGSIKDPDSGESITICKYICNVSGDIEPYEDVEDYDSGCGGSCYDKTFYWQYHPERARQKILQKIRDQFKEPAPSKKDLARIAAQGITCGTGCSGSLPSLKSGAALLSITCLDLNHDKAGTRSYGIEKVGATVVLQDGTDRKVLAKSGYCPIP